MPLTVTSGLTEWDDADTDNWAGDPTVGLDADFQIEGTGCIGIDVDIETLRMFGATKTTTDLSNSVVYAWMLSFSASTLQTRASGGMQICVRDTSNNESYWYVAGSDTYSGGWEVFSADLTTTPDANSGTAANLTLIDEIGVGFVNTAKSKLSQNCFVDWIRYGTKGAAALTVTGTNTTVGDGWSEIQSDDDAGVYGIIRPQRGGYILKGPIQFGDSAGTGSTDFTDSTGTSVIFDDQAVSDTHYNVTVAGNGTGTTEVQLGSVVGTGDDRQGVLGTTIASAGPLWEWDSATDITDLDAVLLYGCTFANAGAGIALDDDTKTTVISCSFRNCGAVDVGDTNDGAEVLNCFVIDPDGATNNYGINLPTQAAGTLTHNTKNISFITSGTPTTQYMVVFDDAADYSIALVGYTFFGDYTSSTIQHGINTGLNADVTINASGGSNPNGTRFTNTNSGTVTVNNTVTVKITVLDTDSPPAAISGARVLLEADTGGDLSAGTDIISGTTDVNGVIENTGFNYTNPQPVTGRARFSSPPGPYYKTATILGTITSNGLDLNVQMLPDS